MEENQFIRLEKLIGKDNLDILKSKSICIFGLGGVGGHALDALVRSGIEKVTIVDFDVVSLSNINRQIIANHNTLGRKKVDVMKEHLLSINPHAKITTYDLFYDENSTFDLSSFDYVIDAIDVIPSKVHLIKTCFQNNIPIISSMGTGNKLNPFLYEINDIYKTSVCPLAKKLRPILKKEGITHLKVLYSKETPMKNHMEDHIVGSIAYMPSIAGLMIASEVIKDLLANKE